VAGYVISVLLCDALAISTYGATTAGTESVIVISLADRVTEFEGFSTRWPHSFSRRFALSNHTCIWRAFEHPSNILRALRLPAQPNCTLRHIWLIGENHHRIQPLLKLR